VNGIRCAVDNVPLSSYCDSGSQAFKDALLAAIAPQPPRGG
jgi:hypothetical protein